jgi:hypothetical protein
MICTVFRNFNIVSFNDDLSAGGFFSSVDHRWKGKTTKIGAIDEDWTEIVEGEVYCPHFRK